MDFPVIHRETLGRLQAVIGRYAPQRRGLGVMGKLLEF